MLPFKLLSHPGFTVDLGAHVFPAQKYRLVRERLLEAGIADHADVVIPRAAGDEDVLRVHTPDYLRKIKAGAFSPAELAFSPTFCGTWPEPIRTSTTCSAASRSPARACASATGVSSPPPGRRESRWR